MPWQPTNSAETSFFARRNSWVMIHKRPKTQIVRKEKKRKRKEKGRKRNKKGEVFSGKGKEKNSRICV